MGNISDSHADLYHYTTAAGLSGILENKSLWATHTSFMNDEEEIVGFYDRVLPSILRPVFGNEQVEKLIHISKRVLPILNDRYITSFSTATDPLVRGHGLLSQWRAYGPDGGYAVVFDTGPLDKILSEELPPTKKRIFYPFGGDLRRAKPVQCSDRHTS